MGCWSPPGSTPDSVAVFIVDPTAAGITRERQVANTGQPEAVLTLAGTIVSARGLARIG